MTEDVARLVLRDNYLQGQALSRAEARGTADLHRQLRLLHELERSGRLDRALEFLPDDKTIAQRAALGRGLVRPELAILLAYAKMSLDDELLRSDLAGSAEIANELRGYFPPALRDRLGARIDLHPLRREIAATVVANDLVNRAGITFVHDMQARAGRPAAEVARAYLIVRDGFGLRPLWAEIEALDNKVPAQQQTAMLLDLADLVEHATAWLLRARRLDLERESARLASSARRLQLGLCQLLPARDRDLLAERSRRWSSAGVPEELAGCVGSAGFLAFAPEIADLAERSGRPLDLAARVFWGAGVQFALDEMRAAARRLPAETSWQRLAVEATIDDLDQLQADLAARILASDSAGEPDPIAAWSGQGAAALAAVETLSRELRAAATPDLAMLVVAGRRLRHALG
jgi:glutamate dehydrogenase